MPLNICHCGSTTGGRYTTMYGLKHCIRKTPFSSLEREQQQEAMPPEKCDEVKELNHIVDHPEEMEAVQTKLSSIKIRKSGNRKVKLKV